ncbi:MAG: UDP-N-acetylmuramate dehydrogenase [bacterium]|nr:UDP-N-acetylmuramate dehydrogenase [bacterium]
MDPEEKLINKLGFNRVRVNEPMSSHTYMKVGGPADVFLEVKTEEELIEAVGLAREFEVPYYILGQGANVLISDKGIRGLVILNRTSAIKFLPHGFVEVESGVNMVQLMLEASKRGLSGLERMMRVPSSVGGAIFMNAGDTGKGEFFGHLVAQIKVLTPEGKIEKVYPEKAGFDYRTSRFQGSGEVILSAKIALKISNKKEIEERVKDILQRKVNHPAGATVGSTFRNPPGGHAGELIEKAGLKGKQIGGAKISEKHGNFIINTGSAKAADVKALVDLMKKEVEEKFNIELLEEVRYLGDWGNG